MQLTLTLTLTLTLHPIPTQATPSCGDAFFYFITEDLGIGPEFLGRVKVGTSLASIFGIWCYRTFLQEVPIKVTLKWTAIASVAAGLSQLLLVRAGVRG